MITQKTRAINRIISDDYIRLNKQFKDESIAELRNAFGFILLKDFVSRVTLIKWQVYVGMN